MCEPDSGGFDRVVYSADEADPQEVASMKDAVRAAAQTRGWVAGGEPVSETTLTKDIGAGVATMNIFDVEGGVKVEFWHSPLDC